jgi:hypothetical protein
MDRSKRQMPVDDEVADLRQRLDGAGLLLIPEALSHESPLAPTLDQARIAAGTGRPLSDFVAEGRR